ncbi:hypothetical protein TKK_0001026 [Trichogramma kaykai]
MTAIHNEPRCFVKCKSVDTLDCKPAPALPPRRSWQQPTTSFAAINVLGVASGSGGGNGASQPPRPSSNSSGSALSDDFVDCARLQEQEKFAKAAAACRDATNRLLLSSSFQLTPPSYPAPPRPPSRNGQGDGQAGRHLEKTKKEKQSVDRADDLFLVIHQFAIVSWHEARR